MDSNEESVLLDLAALITEALNNCLQRGMQLPFVVVVVGPNANLMAVRYDRNDAGDGLVATPLAESGTDGIGTPINIAVEDGVGARVRVVIVADGRMTYH